MRKKALIIAAVALVGYVTPALTAEVWEMSAFSPEANYHTKNVRQFAKDVEEATDGKLQINVHAAQALFQGPEAKQAVRSGQIPIAEIQLFQFGNEHPIYDASSVPFLAGNYEEAQKLWTITEPMIADLLSDQGIKILYSVPWPAQGFYTKEPVDTVADFEGKKMRVYSVITARMAEAMGATPVQIASSEIPQAFGTGLIDLMYTSPQTGINSQAWDFVQNFSPVGGNRAMNAVIVNERAFSRLDPSVQEAVLSAAARAQERGWRMSEELTSEQVKTLEEHGMTIRQPSDAFMDELREIGRELAEEWAKGDPMAEEALREMRQ